MTEPTEEQPYDVVIVGGGVTGTALAYWLSAFTTVRRIVLLEEKANVGLVNSHPLNNAQTSHDGGTETNYSLEHALEVKAAATLLRRYVVSKDDRTLYKKTHRMVLGVGAAEVRQLEERFAVFAKHYPDLRLVYREKLEAMEPNIIKGRPVQEPVCALVSSEGFAINYQRLAEHFIADAGRVNPEFEAIFSSPVSGVLRLDDGYLVRTPWHDFRTRTVLFAAGSFSLLFAQKLGYGKEFAILPVAGSFYSGGELLRGKVYRVQIEGMPFAAIHGDPDVLNRRDTRFGPTTKPLPLMERHRYGTFWDFIKLPLASPRGFWTLMKLLSRKHLFGYVLKNALYDLPVIGPALFLREVRPIVPTIRYRDLKLRRGAGGIRPQIVDLRTGELQMGDKTLVGNNVIFNTTPSPGASVCLGNARRDAERLVGFLGGNHAVDHKAVAQVFGE